MRARLLDLRPAVATTLIGLVVLAGCADSSRSSTATSQVDAAPSTSEAPIETEVLGETALVSPTPLYRDEPFGTRWPVDNPEGAALREAPASIDVIATLPPGSVVSGSGLAAELAGQTWYLVTSTAGSGWVSAASLAGQAAEVCAGASAATQTVGGSGHDDVDGDGVRDVVQVSTTSDGTFVVVTYAAGGQASFLLGELQPGVDPSAGWFELVGVSDFDGDGRGEVVVTGGGDDRVRTSYWLTATDCGLTPVTDASGGPFGAPVWTGQSSSARWGCEIQGAGTVVVLGAFDATGAVVRTERHAMRDGSFAALTGEGDLGVCPF